MVTTLVLFLTIDRYWGLILFTRRLLAPSSPRHCPISRCLASPPARSATSVNTIPVNSWVSSDHNWRVFFSGVAYLPKDTPTPLLDERRRELEELQVCTTSQ